jgi:hypothetical protein
MQYQDGHISTCFNKDTRDIYIVHMLVPVIRYLFICALLFVTDHSLFCSLFDYLFCFILTDSLLICCSKENTDPELVQVFRSRSTRYPVSVKQKK